MHVIEDVLDDVSVVLLIPDGAVLGHDLALWMTHLGGSADKERRTMTWLADTGHPVVSFDPPGHGRRATTTDTRAFSAEVLESFRERMWPLLGRTTLEAMRVITWAQQRLGQADSPVVAGGVSMGGDVAIALAGIDDRVRRVATVGSTPDWTRPGMCSLMDPSELIDQGHADRYAEWFEENLNPSRHVGRFSRDLHLSFELGGNDHHIPVGNAEHFRQSVIEQDATAAARIRLTVHPGLDHFGVTSDERALRAAVGSMVGSSVGSRPLRSD